MDARNSELFQLKLLRSQSLGGEQKNQGSSNQPEADVFSIFHEGAIQVSV